MLRLSGVMFSVACIGLGPGLFAPAQQIAPATPSNAPPTFTLRDAIARARAEIAARGLLLTIVQRFYGLAAAQRKYATAQNALNEAERFLRVSTQLENGGEVAHSDVIKAQIQANDRKRDVQEAQLTLE